MTGDKDWMLGINVCVFDLSIMILRVDFEYSVMKCTVNFLLP